MSTQVLRRVVRRETHSPRTVATFVAVVLSIIVLAYVGVEVVLQMAGQPPVLGAPADVLNGLAALPSQQPIAAVVAGAAVVALVGLVLLVLAITPGRLSKQELNGGAHAVIVDNGVVAASLAQHVSDETGIARDDVLVGVGHRTADVTVRVTPGVPLDQAELERVVSARVEAYGFVRRLKTRVRIERPRESESER